MKIIKAGIATIMVGSFLVWLYCILRIFTGNIDFNEEFISGIDITFLNISIASFIIFLDTLFLYLCLMEE